MSRRQLERGAALRGVFGADGIEPLSPGAVPDSGCPVLHVDMDAFFTAVERLERPELRDTPIIVGGTGPRGVVSSADYLARGYGVHSAMPMARALRLCPAAAVFSPDGSAYRRVSKAVQEILLSVTPEVEPLGVDESFLDVSGARLRLGSPVRVAELIRARVAAEQGLTCSVGVAPSKFVAKLASTHCKPDGLLLVPVERVTAFLHPLPVGALWGVGDKTEQALRRLGLRTVGDVARTPEPTLRSALGEAAGSHLAALAWGRDPRRVDSEAAAEKSIGTEETFPRDVADPVRIRRELLELSEKVARRLRAAGVAGRTVVLKLRRGDFSTITRSRTLAAPTDLGRDISAAARELYAESGLVGVPLRLVGVRAEGLSDSASVHRQLAFDEPETGWRDAEGVMDQAVRRFGAGALRPASLANRDENDV